MDVIHVGEVDYCCMVQFTLVQFIIIQFIMRFKENTRLACKVVEKNISKLITLNVVSAIERLQGSVVVWNHFHGHVGCC